MAEITEGKQAVFGGQIDLDGQYGTDLAEQASALEAGGAVLNRLANFADPSGVTRIKVVHLEEVVGSENRAEFISALRAAVEAIEKVVENLRLTGNYSTAEAEVAAVEDS